MPLRTLILFGLAILLAEVGRSARSAEPDPELVEAARATLERATAFVRSVAVEGGYVWTYSEDLSERAGEKRATDSQVWVQYPSTPAVGDVFVRAYRSTGDARYLEAARDAAMALVRGQLGSGGWDYLIEFDPAKRSGWHYRRGAEPLEDAKNRSVYDDGNTQGALRFLMAYLAAAGGGEADLRDEAIREAARYGLDKLVGAQYPIGAWPQRWDGQPRDVNDFPILDATIPENYPETYAKAEYYECYTLNDDSHVDLLRTLYAGAAFFENEAYRSAVHLGADFLLRAQLPAPQAGWAQQYNVAMEPAWARAFEPPAVASRETVGAAMALLGLYAEWGDHRHLLASETALEWLERSQIGPGRWARFYELGTNRPIYGDRDGAVHYTLAEISEERRSGYGWEGTFGAPKLQAAVGYLKSEGRERWLERYGSLLDGGRRRISFDQDSVEAAINSLDDRGRWMTKGSVSRGNDMSASQIIRMRTFIERANDLCALLEVAAAVEP